MGKTTVANVEHPDMNLAGCGYFFGTAFGSVWSVLFWFGSADFPGRFVQLIVSFLVDDDNPLDKLRPL